MGGRGGEGSVWRKKERLKGPEVRQRAGKGRMRGGGFRKWIGLGRLKRERRENGTLGFTGFMVS